MANIYVGESKALVFPVMCEGHLKLEYDDTNTADSKGNLWNLDESFVVEALFTPYDVNGNTSSEVTDSTKTVPIGTANTTESGVYFGADRLSHKMMLFYNEYFRLYLENTTSSNTNQPAEYKIVAYIADITTGSAVYTTVQTDTVIKAINTLYGYYDADGFYNGNATSLTKLDEATIDNTNTSIIELDTASNTSKVGVGEEIFNSSGISKGTITSIDTTQGTLTMNTAQGQAATGYTAYHSQPREAFYIEQIYKVSCVYNTGGSVDIYLNNTLLKTHSYTTSPTFDFKNDDCFIGQDGTNKNTQFMGELFEIAMFKGRKPSATTNTLSPSYSNILFYYSFGE